MIRFHFRKTTVILGARGVFDAGAPRVKTLTTPLRSGTMAMRMVRAGTTGGIIVTRWPDLLGAKLASRVR